MDDITQIEKNIENWPQDWGDDLLIILYGDFLPPSEDVALPALGIKINHENKRDSKFFSARCVLDVSIKVNEKSVSAVLDALGRLNLFLGVWVLSGGCHACSWWSYITHGPIGRGVGFCELDIGSLNPVCDAIRKLPDPVRLKVNAALYWVRAPRNLSMNYQIYENDSLRVYSGYWNAFECLVEAVNMIMPRPKLSPSEKQEKIDAFIVKQKTDHGQIETEDIVKCYLDIVNPGFRGKAVHALTVCFHDSTPYIENCFGKPERDSLYQIRNDIDHGNIDAENPQELLRVEHRFIQLYRIVRNTFDWISQSDLEQGCL